MTTKRKFKTRFDFDQVKTVIEGDSKTKSEFQKDADINNILKKYNTTGQLPAMIAAEPSYGDFSEAPDYLEAMAIVIKAQDQFHALPADVRDRFGNDPSAFLQFASDPNNSDAMVRMGLATAKKIEPASPAPPQPEAKPKAEG